MCIVLCLVFSLWVIRWPISVETGCVTRIWLWKKFRNVTYSVHRNILRTNERECPFVLHCPLLSRLHMLFVSHESGGRGAGLYQYHPRFTILAVLICAHTHAHPSTHTDFNHFLLSMWARVYLCKFYTFVLFFLLIWEVAIHQAMPQM